MFSIDGHTAKDQADWQSGFISLLPKIEQRLAHVYWHFDPDRRDEAIQSATVFCLLSYMRLHERGCVRSVTASTLVWYAVLQVKCGRPAVGRANSKELLSPYAQRRRRITVTGLQAYDRNQEHWIDDLAADKRASVADQVAVKLDFRAWLATLSHRTRRIAADLAMGFTTSETARKYRLSRGRISQIRRSLENSWREFQGEYALLPVR